MPRRSRWTRARAALLALPVLLVAAPLVMARASEPVACQAAHDGGLNWQWMPLPAGISNPTGFGVDYTQPNRLLVSNASQIYISDDHGCSWVNAVSLDTLAQDAGYSSAISRIVDVGFNLKGEAIATISEGVGSEARPHVIHSRTGARHTWTTADTGLPSVGEPRTMAATLFGFVIGIAQFGTDLTGGGGLPGGIGGTDPTGQVPAMVYTSNDGTSWRAGAGVAGFEGQRVISAIAGDLVNAAGIYAVAGGKLYYSRDRGATFRPTTVPGVPSAIAPTLFSEVTVYGSGFAARSTNGGVTFRPVKAVPGALSAAWRVDGSYLVASRTKVVRTTGGTHVDVTPVTYPGGTPTLRSTFIGEATWYLTVGSRLYRWFDKYKPAKQPPGVPNQRISFPPPAGSITPARPVFNLRPGGSRTQTYRLHLPKSPTPIDVYYLLDVSGSMLEIINDLKQNAKDIGVTLSRQGINIQEGVAAIGTAPNIKAGVPPDPPSNPNPNDPRGPYHQPVLYKRWAPVGAVNSNFFAALRKLEPEYYLGQAGPCPPTATDWNGCEQHMEGALVSLMQAVNGDGIPAGPLLPVGVAPGQSAEFRQSEDVRRVIVLATDEKFWAPPGTPMTAEGKPNLALVGKLLRDHGIRVVGLSNDAYEARPFLRQMAALTGTLAPKGGLPCKYGDDGVRIPEGQPVVCENQQGVTKVIATLLASLPDFQTVAVRTARTSPVLRGGGTAVFPKVNVKSVFDGEFTATYSCAGVPSGSYAVAIEAQLRGFTVARTVATVNCGAAVVPVTRPDPVPVAQNPPGNPAPPPPAPLPAQPVTQVQSQVQTQVQVNPQVGAAAQQEEQLQLALAQAGIFAVDDDEKVTQQAMSRREEERAAVAALAAALAATSIVGLAMMRRHRTQQAVAPAWARRR